MVIDIIKKIMIILYIFHFQIIFPFINKTTLIRTIYTPDSILNRKNSKKYKPLCLGKRKRCATATGASWFHENYLATLNLYGEKISTYKFDSISNQFSLLQEITNRDGAKLKQPEHLVFSPDETIIAVSCPLSSFINFYRINLQNHLINPVPFFTLKSKGFVHNVRFTSDGNYFAFASFQKNESVSIFKINNNNNHFYLTPTYVKTNPEKFLRAKAVNFTKDNQYAIVGYALGIRDTKNQPLKSLLTIHQFNSTNGTLGKIVCKAEGNFSLEDIALSSNEDLIMITDQAYDSIVAYPFDNQTGIVGSPYTLIENPEGKLSFPHGICTKPNSDFIVVTNYGTDSYNLYQLK